MSNSKKLLTEIEFNDQLIKKGDSIVFYLGIWINEEYISEQFTAVVKGFRIDPAGKLKTSCIVSVYDEDYLIAVEEIISVISICSTDKNSCTNQGEKDTTAGTVKNDCADQYFPELQTKITVPPGTDKNNCMDQNKTDQDPKDKNVCTGQDKKYPGQKKIEGVYQAIINNIPKCDKYYELYAGTGAIAKLVKKYSPGTYIHCNDINEKVIDKINFKCNKLSSFDTTYYLNRYREQFTPNNFIFLDMPYHPDTRPNSLNLYEYEMTHHDHVNLISSVLQLKCNIMIIHPDHKLYNTLIDHGWRKVPIKLRYHNKTSHEYLYMNYSTPSELLITRYIGSDCWDRQRIKRMGDRTVNKLKRLPPLEKQYILERIINEFIEK